MNSQDLRYLQEAYFDVYRNDSELEQLDEAEGSYGQTPKARKAYGDLANKRRETPASGFSKRGEKTKKVKSAERHFNRTGNPDAGNRGKKSTTSRYPRGRQGFKMTQGDRDYSRGEAEYGHVGYDPDWDGGPSAPGSKPKGKKLERQRKTGVSAESYDLYDLILSHLLDEGYAETLEAAETIMVHMSEDWRESIVEELEQLDEISQKTATRAFALRATDEFETDDTHDKSDRTKRRIERKFGKKAGKHAERAAHARIFGRKGLGGMPSA